MFTSCTATNCCLRRAFYLPSAPSSSCLLWPLHGPVQPSLAMWTSLRAMASPHTWLTSCSAASYWLPADMAPMDATVVMVAMAHTALAADNCPRAPV